MIASLHPSWNGIVIISAWIMDLVFGDPRWFPHPVRGIGWLISRTESFLRRFSRGPQAEKISGIVLVVLITSAVYFATQWLLLSLVRISPYLGSFLAILVAYTTLAARGLGDAAKVVLRHLDAGDIVQARESLAQIVGRDTQDLDEHGITRAVVETVAENTSDGVVAPLFYLALGGPALALAYKAVNTMDSMVGYKNEKYHHFGWAAARLDDIANFIPARITGMLICLSVSAMTCYRSSCRDLHTGFLRSWRIMLRDGRNHPSPNSGYPEAAMAGALGMQLGGPSSYNGIPGMKPFLGDDLHVFDKKYIEKAAGFMYCTSLFAAVGAAAAAC